MNQVYRAIKVAASLATAAGLCQCSGTGGNEAAMAGARRLPTWSIQYQGAIVPRGKDYHIVDLFDVKDSELAALRAQGTKPIAYFSSQYENWRSDSSQFPAADLGNKLDTWEGERWVNTRSAAIRSIMLRRMDYAKQRGFYGVDLDNVDFSEHPNGFGAGQGAAEDYVRFLANAAHARGLKYCLKNATALISKTRDVVDYYVNEQAHEYGDLDEYAGVTKPIFCIEYKPLRAAWRNFYTVYKPSIEQMDARETVVPNLP
jgi:Glycoside-hydrolase family GH114